MFFLTAGVSATVLGWVQTPSKTRWIDWPEGQSLIFAWNRCKCQRRRAATVSYFSPAAIKHARYKENLTNSKYAPLFSTL
jgi:hypothetical protein